MPALLAVALLSIAAVVIWTWVITPTWVRVAADAYTVFMAVPTIYVKLIEALEASPPAARQPIVDGFAKMRLMIFRWGRP